MTPIDTPQKSTSRQEKHDIRAAVDCLQMVAELIASGYSFQDISRDEIIHRLRKAHRTLVDALPFGPSEPIR